MIVICRRTAASFAQADCWLAAQNLMLAATALSLGSCCIGFAIGALNEPDIKRELAIPPEGAAVAPIIIGYARTHRKAVSRKPPEVLRWVR